MPELPEVETVRLGLEKKYLNLKFKHIDVFYDKILENISSNEFKEKLINQTIDSFERKGKILILNLSNGYLLIHLRMEGKFKFDNSLFDKHSHVRFTFTNDDVLIYHDVRKFGKMFYYDKDVNIFENAPLNKLGLEPFEVKDASYLYNKLQKSKKPIKTSLLDQSILAGIGNIYADEICFACKIDPHSISNTISLQKCIEIIHQASVILKEAIKDGGSTIKSFQSTHGVDGLFQQKLNVYGKANKPCPRCNELIVKTFINQRGTHYCKNCQKG